MGLNKTGFYTDSNIFRLSLVNSLFLLSMRNRKRFTWKHLFLHDIYKWLKLSKIVILD